MHRVSGYENAATALAWQARWIAMNVPAVTVDHLVCARRFCGYVAARARSGARVHARLALQLRHRAATRPSHVCRPRAFVRLQGMRHRCDMGEPVVKVLPSSLAGDRRMVAVTRKQSPSALLCGLRRMFGIDSPRTNALRRRRRRARISVTGQAQPAAASTPRRDRSLRVIGWTSRSLGASLMRHLVYPRAP